MWVERRAVKRSERYPQGAAWPICDRQGRKVHVVESGFARRSDAEARLDILRGDRPRGVRADLSKKGTTLEAFFPIFMERRSLAPATRALYAQEWTKHIRPTLGSMPLGKITRAEVKRFLGRLEFEGVGAATVRAVYQLLRASC
jgi:Phage integrase, N-terminal SAM-like domain